MFFSIVIPVYNRAHSIRETLLSVLDQTFKDFECIIVDDGSSDFEDLRVLVSSLDDDRLILIRQDNGGGGAARNTGIGAAVGRWICFLDSDDAFLNNKLEEVANAIAASPGMNVWSHFTKMVRSDNVSVIRPRRIPGEGDSISNMMFKEREFLQTSTLAVEAVFAKQVRFDNQLRKAQDVDFMWRAELAGLHLGFVPIVLSIWNDEPADGRVGSPRKPEAIQSWFDKHKSEMTRDLSEAFQATYLAYEISGVSPWRSVLYILRATFSGSIGINISVLTFFRCFLSERSYRAFVDHVLYARSKFRSNPG